MTITKSEYEIRLLSVQQKLQQEGIDFLIVSEEEDIYYLTGLTYKSLERLFILVISPSKATFILPKMELAHLKHVDHVSEIKVYWEYPAAEPDRWQDVLHQILKGGKMIGIGDKAPFEIADFLVSMQYNICRSDIIERLRWIKSVEEIRLIRRAAQYCDHAISLLNDRAYFGMSELEVFSIGNTIQRKLIKETDYDFLASNVLVAAWPSRISYQPHGVPEVGDLLVEGSHISLAFLRVNGYAAELERTFFTHPPKREQEEIFAIMMEARRRSYSVLKAGVPAEEVDYASKRFLQDEGFSENIMHRTGHGIGLGNHEGPYLAEGDKTILKENMVVSIEPGIYIEDLGGYRHSDTVRVTKEGYEILTNCVDEISDLTFTASRPLERIKGKIIRNMFKI